MSFDKLLDLLPIAEGVESDEENDVAKATIKEEDEDIERDVDADSD